MQTTLHLENIDKGAKFSEDGKHRLYLWRIWDFSLPIVMFIGLNPSTANHESDDPTIKRVCQIAKHNGFGGVYMLNCFTYISTDPNLVIDESTKELATTLIETMALNCTAVVFAWGNFKAITEAISTLFIARKHLFLFRPCKINNLIFNTLCIFV